MRKLTRRTGTVAATIAAVTGIGVAFAAWTSTGTGSGYAASGEDAPLTTVSVAASTASLLYPTGDADVRLTVKNDNPYNVKITAINNGTGSILSADTVCDASNGVTFSNTPGTWVVGANDTLNIELPAAAHMSNASVDACQNETFTIPVTMVAASTGDPADADDF